MTATNNLNRTLLTETQSQKATGANTQVGEVDAALTATITVELLVGNTSYSIQTADLRRCSLMVFDEAVSTPIAANFTATWTPFDRGLVSFFNATAFIATLRAASGTTDSIRLPPGGFVTFRIGLTRSVIVGQPSTSYIKAPCRAATTANIVIASDLNVGDTIDGVVLADGDRVLVKDQTTASENGIYIAGASPARSTDWNEAGDVLSGVVVAVTEGTSNGDSMFMLTTDVFPIVPGTTNIAFDQFGGGGGGGGGPATGYPAPVRVATTANITIASALNSGDSIDGVTLADGDRVLVKNQSTASENGIYVVAGSPARATDFDSNLTEVVGGSIVFVLEGTVNQGKQFVLSTTGAITVGSTNLTFTELASYKPPIDISFFFSGTPDVSITLAEKIFTFAASMPDDFAGSYGRVGTNPSSTTVLDVQKNGSSVGSISISSGGVFTFSTTGGATSFSAGDRVAIITPVNLNGLANLTIALAGTRTL